VDTALEKPLQCHYPALDGLRGVAALSIVWHHFLQLVPMHGRVLSSLTRVSGFTWVGVDLFFVLSGFLITGILADAKSKQYFFRTFYGRRILRIFPLYYAVLVVVLLILPLMGTQTGVTPASHIFFWTYTSNFYFAFAGWDANYLSHLWTLAIEEQFYLVWPLIIFFAKSMERLRGGLLWAFFSISLLRGVLYLLGVDYRALNLDTLTHCDALILGGYLALSLRSGAQSAFKGLRPSRTVAALAITIVILLSDMNGFVFGWDAIPVIAFGRATIMFALLAIIFVWLIYAATDRTFGFAFRFFSHPVLMWLGKYSYALYILHVPLAFLVLRPDLPGLSSTPLFAQLELFVLYFGVCITSAFLSWHLYEKHFLKLKRYFQADREISEHAHIIVAGDKR
jgi:peptidoglycan/LPS O-acetylase OafA/YrhL